MQYMVEASVITARWVLDVSTIMVRARLLGANVLRIRVGLCPDFKHERLLGHQSRYCKGIVCSLIDVQVKQQRHQEGRSGVPASTIE